MEGNVTNYPANYSTSSIPIEDNPVESLPNADRVLRVVYSIVGVMGIFGNLVVCVILSRVRFLRTLNNLFILHQSIVDSIGAVLIIVYYALPAPELPAGRVADFVCRFWLSRYLLWATYSLSTFNMTMISAERYFSIVFPYSYKRLFTLRRAKLIFLIEWCLCFGFKSFIFFVVKIGLGYECYVQWPSYTHSVVFGVLTFVLEYVLPLFAMIFAYGSIFKVLSGNKIGQNPTGPGSKANLTFIKAKKNIVKTLVIVLLAYVICWSPNQVFFLFHSIGNPINFKFDSLFYHLTVVMATSNTFVNPVIYCIKYRHFQAGLKLYVNRHLRSRNTSELSVTEDVILSAGEVVW